MEIMVDIETLSTAPTAAVVSIGLAAFNREEIIATLGIFINAEDIDGHLDPATVKWWMQQPNCAQAMKGTTSRLVAVNEVLAFFGRFAITGVWANSPSFDLVILKEWWKRRDTGPLPWTHKLERDYRTLRALAKELNIETPEWTGQAHDPVVDAENQARTVISILQQLHDLQNVSGALR